MKISINKKVWQCFSVFFLTLFLIIVGGEVQAKDVSSGLELKKALAQGESSITVTSSMLTIPKNTEITNDVTIDFNKAVLFFEDNQTPALIGKKDCEVRIQNAFIIHDSKKVLELRYGGAPALNGKGTMNAYYTNAFGIVSGLQAHGAQMKSLTFENINWNASSITSANRFLAQDTGATYFEGTNIFNYSSEKDTASLIANSLIVTKGSTAINENQSGGKALWYSGNPQEPEMRLQVNSGAKLQWLGRANNYGWIEHNALSKEKKFIFDNQGTVMFHFGATTNFKTSKSSFWQVRFFLRENATTFIYTKGKIWDLDMFEVSQSGKKLDSKTVSDPAESSFYFRAFKGSTTWLDSDDKLVSKPGSKPNDPYFSENRIYTAITEVAAFIMSSANQQMLNQNTDFKIYVNQEADQTAPLSPIRLWTTQQRDASTGLNSGRDDIAIVSGAQKFPTTSGGEYLAGNFDVARFIGAFPSTPTSFPTEKPLPVTPPNPPIVVPPVAPRSDWSVSDEDTLKNVYMLEDMDIYGGSSTFSRTSQLTQDFQVNLLAKNTFKLSVTLKTDAAAFPHQLIYRTANGDVPLVPGKAIEILTNQTMSSSDAVHFITSFGDKEGIFVSSSRQVAEAKSYPFTLEWTFEESGQTAQTMETDGSVTFGTNGLMLKPNLPFITGNNLDNPNHEQDAGALSLSFTKWPKTFNFGTIDISALTQAKGLRKNALKKAADEVTDMIGDQTLQVFDGRVFKEGVNWSVNAKATTFKAQKATGTAKEIRGAKIILTNTKAQTTDPSATSGLRTETVMEILADDQNTSTTTLFGNENGKQVKGWSDLSWQPESVSLDIPQGQAKLGTFESVVTWTLVDQAVK